MKEKDLRNITTNGKDLLSCLNRQESEDYHREEGKGKYQYYKSRVTYKTKAERCGKGRRWKQKEIKMYEQLKDYKTTTELILMLMKLDGRVSAKSARESLKDHSLKPGSRGIAQAINRIHERLEPIMQKYQKGREVFYHFADDRYRDIDLQDLYGAYLRKIDIHDLIISKESKQLGLISTDDEVITKLITAYEEIRDSLAKTQKRVYQFEQFIKIFENTVQPSGQRLDVHFYFHFGKED